jgi:hypothetical protein
MIDAKKIKQFALPNLPYVFLFWLFGKCGEAVRTAPGKDLLQQIMHGVGNLNTTLAKPLPSLNPQDLLVGLIGAAAVYLFVLYKKHNAKKWRKDVLRYKGWHWITTYKTRRSLRLRHNRRTPKLERGRVQQPILSENRYRCVWRIYISAVIIAHLA